jgi:hypothetical protein
VGVVGHRFLTAEGAAFTSRSCARLLSDIRTRHSRVTALSALAEGADTLFASAAVRLGVPLDVVQPHNEYPSDFGSSAALAAYERLVAKARHRRLMAYRQRSGAAYRAAMRLVADDCDVLAAVWDGHPSASVGGTADTVRYARARGRTIVQLNPLEQRVSFG